MFLFHFWTLQATLSDNMLNWFNFDPYLCNCIKVVLSIIWQACCKLCKIFFLYSFYRPNEKTAKIWCFAPTVLIIFTDGLSTWTYPFIIIDLNIIKTFHLINSKNIPRKFYATTAPCFWKIHLLVLFKMSLWVFFKKCSVNSALFVASDAVFSF